MAQADPRDPSMGRRTIVVSDAHGHVELIQNALDNADFGAGEDFLVYAGDVVDGGARVAGAEACLDVLRRNEAQMLWGNHDVAAMLDFPSTVRTGTRGPTSSSLRRGVRSGRPCPLASRRLRPGRAHHARRAWPRLPGRPRASGGGAGGVIPTPWPTCWTRSSSRQRSVSARRGAVTAGARLLAPRASSVPSSRRDLGPNWVARWPSADRRTLAVRALPGRPLAAHAHGAVGLHLIDPCYHVRADRLGGSGCFRYAEIMDGRVEVYDEGRPRSKG